MSHERFMNRLGMPSARNGPLASRRPRDPAAANCAMLEPGERALTPQEARGGRGPGSDPRRASGTRRGLQLAP